MKDITRIVLICFLCLSICVLITSFFFLPDETAPAVNASFAISQGETSKSNMDSGNGLPASLKLTNNSSADVIIVGFSSICTCVTRDFPLPLAIDRGDSKTLALIVHPGEKREPVPVKLFIQSKGGTFPQTVMVKPFL